MLILNKDSLKLYFYKVLKKENKIMKKILISGSIVLIIIMGIILGMIYIKSESKPEPTSEQSEQDIEKMKEKARNLKRDIIIDTVSKSENMESTGGYSKSYSVVSLEDKKLYHIYYHGFLGEDPDEYRISEKDLTQEQIEQLMQLENMESEEIDITEDEGTGKTYKNNYYWEITYKGKVLTFNNLPFPKEILNIK